MADIQTIGTIIDNESQVTPRIVFKIAKWDAESWGKVANGWDSDHVDTGLVSALLDNVMDSKQLTVKVNASEADALNAYILLEKAEKFGQKGKADKDGVLDKFQLNILVDNNSHRITFKEPKVILSKTASENKTNFLVFTVKTKLPPIKNGAAI